MIIIIYHEYPVLQRYLPFIIREWLCCCLQVNYIVYKHFDRSLHIWLLDPTCVQNLRPVPLMVFEIQGFKLNKKKQKNWRNGLFALYISHVSGPILTKF